MVPARRLNGCVAVVVLRPRRMRPPERHRRADAELDAEAMRDAPPTPAASAEESGCPGRDRKTDRASAVDIMPHRKPQELPAIRAAPRKMWFSNALRTRRPRRGRRRRAANLTYTYRTDQELLEASRTADAYCTSNGQARGLEHHGQHGWLQDRGLQVHPGMTERGACAATAPPAEVNEQVGDEDVEDGLVMLYGRDGLPHAFEVEHASKRREPVAARRPPPGQRLRRVKGWKMDRMPVDGVRSCKQASARRKARPGGNCASSIRARDGASGSRQALTAAWVRPP